MSEICTRPLVPGSARLKNPRWRPISKRNEFSAMKPPVTACKQATFFARAGKTLVPNLNNPNPNTLNVGLPSFVFTIGGRSTRKENTLCSKQDFTPITLLVIVAPILKVAGREFISIFSFTCRQFDMVEISNDCMCVN